MGLLYNTCYLNSNDLGVIIFQNLGCLVFFVYINFRGPRDFVNRRGLLIQGGDCMYVYIYIIHMYVYIYIYIYISRFFRSWLKGRRGPGRQDEQPTGVVKKTFLRKSNHIGRYALGAPNQGLDSNFRRRIARRMLASKECLFTDTGMIGRRAFKGIADLSFQRRSCGVVVQL